MTRAANLLCLFSICAIAGLAACGTPAPARLTLSAQSDVAGDSGNVTEVAGEDAPAGADAEPTDAVATDAEDVAAAQDADVAEDAEVADDVAVVQDVAVVDDTTPADAESPVDSLTDTNVDDTPGMTDATSGTDTTGDPDAADAADAADSADMADTADASQPPKPGAATSCDADPDCLGTNSGKKCALQTHTCVACLQSADCNLGELCQGQACVISKVCKSDTDCKATQQVCDKAEGVCVDCASDADCDGAKCLDHGCVKTTACQSSKDCTLVCDKAMGICAQCTSGADCKDGEYCQAGTCAPKLCTGPVCAGGKAFACKPDGGGYEAGKSCDDGNACSEGDACDVGVCKPGPAKGCDDANPCTTDSCAPQTGCLSVHNTAGCDDGDKCTELDKCAAGKCAGSAKICDDAQLCTADSCKDGACLHAAQPGVCSDGTACTDGDLCDAGKCKAGKTLGCDDLNACTVDSCDPAKGCLHVDKAGACDDGNNCTQNDACALGKCTGVGKQCDDGNPCTDDKCDAGICSFLASTKACDDGNGCTESDVCLQGKCNGKLKLCDDGNPCTTDTCAGGACVLTANALACDDGDKCSDADACAAGKCAGKQKVCNDDNLCTDDVCVGGTCVASANTKPCGDPGACSVCSQGKCQGIATAGFEEFYGGGNTDRFFDVVPGQGGGWLLLGSTASKGNGGEDGWVVRVDAKGIVQWEKTFGSSSNDILRAGVPIATGGYLTVGSRYYSTGGTNLWVQKLEANGLQTWSKDFGGAYTDGAYAVATNDKGWLVAGSLGKYCGSSCTSYAGWVIQLDFDGNKLWDKEIAGMAYLSDVASTSDGNLLVFGQGKGPSGSYDWLVQKLKPGGAQIWSTAIGSASYNDVPGGMLQTADGSIFVSGRTYVGSSERPTLARLDAAGTIQWSQTYGDAWGEFDDLAEVNGKIIAVGQRYQNSQYDAYLVGVDKASGVLQWEKKPVQSAYYSDQLRSITANAAGGFVAVGDAYDTAAYNEGWLLSLSADAKLACSCDTTCTDDNPCTTDACYLGTCKSSSVNSGTACSIGGVAGTCSSSGACIAKCGNGYCDSGESIATCPADCKPLPAHYCDSHCGQSGLSGSGCFCGNNCNYYSDCCNSTGTSKAGKYCTGSTCALCK